MSDEEGPSYKKGGMSRCSQQSLPQKDIRDLFNGPSGVYFWDKIVVAGLEPRLGVTICGLVK